MNEWMGELYVQAIAIEREAAGRYGELAEVMTAQGNHAVAALFRMLAAHEARHLEELQRKTAGIMLPALDADYSWPETLQADAAQRPLTTESALAMALAAEKRARSFFEQAARIASDRETRALAHEMAREEAEHVAFIERMMRAGHAADWRSAAN